MRLLRRGPGTTSCRRGHAIGLDLGATAARVTVLSVERGGERTLDVERNAAISLPSGTVVNGVVTDPAVLTTLLKELWRREELSCRHVVLGVAGTQVQVRELQVPDLDPVRQAQALPFQAREVVALPLESVVLDFAPLGPGDPETGLVDGLLVATPRTPVEAAVAAVEAAGLRVDRVDLASFAVLRSVASPGPDCEAVIDLGAHLTTVVVHHRGVPSMVRTLARGGQEVTDRLAQRLDVTTEEAERVKQTADLGAGDVVAAALRDVVAPLLTDIRTSLNYFRSNHPGVQVDQVLLTGGAARLPGLAAAVEHQVGIPTAVPDAPSALSTGLAIGAAA